MRLAYLRCLRSTIYVRRACTGLPSRGVLHAYVQRLGSQLLCTPASSGESSPAVSKRMTPLTLREMSRQTAPRAHVSSHSRRKEAGPISHPLGEPQHATALVAVSQRAQRN